jgi:hypothetical protein
MARTKRFSKVGINTQLIIDAAIAQALVEVGPELLNRFLFSTDPLADEIKTAAGVGLAYLYGMLLKNNNVANIGIGVGAVKFLTPTLMQLVGGTATVGDYFNIGDYGNIKDYVDNPSNRMQPSVYKDSY